MLIKLDNPKILADSISLLSELVLEVKAKINKDGFEITAIDPANVALVSLKIPAKVFSQFDLDKEEEKEDDKLDKEEDKLDKEEDKDK